MYILNASVEATHIGAVTFDLLRCNVSSVMVTAITNAPCSSRFESAAPPSKRVGWGLNSTNW